MLTEYLIELILLALLLAIYLIPIVLVVLIAKKIHKAIKNRKNIKKSHLKPTTEYTTGWKWNEKTQLWEPPDNLKNSKIKLYKDEPSFEEWKIKNNVNTTNQETNIYHYKGADLPKEDPQQTHFHHTDTTFKVPQKPRDATPKENAKWTRPKEEAESHYTTPTHYNQYYTWTPPKSNEPTNTSNDINKNKSINSEYKDAYESANLLTKNESQNYRVLRNAADKKGYVICPKVRLADIVKPRNDSKYMSHFGKIKSKHVDFVICDRDMRIKAIIELDDKSHDRKDRQERDNFVDSILMDVGYKVIHTRYITPDILEGI